MDRKGGEWTPGSRLRRQIAGCLVMLLVLPVGVDASARTSAKSPGQQSRSDSSAQVPPSTAGDGSGSSDAPATQRDTLPNGPDRKQPAASAQQVAPNQTPGETKNPVGVAVAPYTTTIGVPASRPAGAVIAPAKQRRVRSILIRVGVLVGAGIAIGTVAALSAASSSRPH